MELFLMSLTTGIMVGGIYALVALGWVLIYKCSGVLNLAMGELTLIGAYVTYTFHAIGVPFVPAVILTLLVGIILGFLTERIFLDKLIGEPILAVIMVTVGLSFFLKGLIGYLWGADTRVFTPPIFDIKPISVGMLMISPVYLWSFILAIVLLIVFVCFFKYTRWGLSMQATADDETAALSLGVSARFVYAAAWAIAFMSAGVGGALLGNINGINISVGYLGLSTRSHCGRHSDRTAPEFFRDLPGSIFPGRGQGDRPLCLHGGLSPVQALRPLGLGTD